jgi:Flp pilus assembly protein TadG
MAPILVALVVFTVDFSLYLYAKMRLSNAVSAGAAYALANGQLVSANSAGCSTATPPCLTVSGFRSNVSTIVQNATSLAITAPTVYYNTSAASGTDTSAIYANCYCPDAALTAAGQTAVSCGTACANTTQPGSFVVIQASSSFTPMFAGDLWLPSGALSATAWVRIQ